MEGKFVFAAAQVPFATAEGFFTDLSLLGSPRGALSLSCRASQILFVISRTRLSSYYPIIEVTNDFSGSCSHPSQRRIYP